MTSRHNFFNLYKHVSSVLRMNEMKQYLCQYVKNDSMPVVKLCQIETLSIVILLMPILLVSPSEYFQMYKYIIHVEL